MQGFSTSSCSFTLEGLAPWLGGPAAAAAGWGFVVLNVLVAEGSACRRLFDVDDGEVAEVAREYSCASTCRLGLVRVPPVDRWGLNCCGACVRCSGDRSDSGAGLGRRGAARLF